ncbi:hypothetical protein A584_04520 [Pseudomonas syringae pv. theae ICMP 3923]|uniref:Uncharacterized protein n=3 Tax=Pseudomonas syringae group TaxID=136849 RepID=A0A2G9KZ83_PSESF|nr:hypothetical protein JN853_14850 [Pseudomonas syringae pv. actinidiae ICMP 9853]AQX59803.1 hypothetical protein B1R35_18040 [Pseudomonas syringae pv. actinidiae]AYL81712.1 hypothetical protein CN228_18935 [Pseudomonas syringae pv. actinidiae str. Shaanxi_M228]EGH65430.1 hypothetical protein PSYAC_11061 [Pseudomonas syringae pv. actinidiae str. M302091]EPM55331.1 hypothetical protein A264_23438 [Pseudomonas syringae pv. actinidiae ICMP 19071]EPM57562.1 hypothetical protein A256_04304 [Pseudo
MQGICWYPILDYPGWDDARYCPAGLPGYADGQGQRAAYHPLHKALCDRASEFDTLTGQKGGNFLI